MANVAFKPVGDLYANTAQAAVSIRIEGVAPLIMHSLQGLDPQNPLTRRAKEINAKRTKKTDADLEELVEIDFMQGCYYSKDPGFYIPAPNVLACIRDGAKAERKGKNVESGFVVLGEKIPLILPMNEPQTPDGRFKAGLFNQAGVRVSQARVLRTRPIFHDWAMEFQALMDTGVLNGQDLQRAIVTAGLRKGLGDWRPAFGRFRLANIEQVEMD